MLQRFACKSAFSQKAAAAAVPVSAALLQQCRLKSSLAAKHTFPMTFKWEGGRNAVGTMTSKGLNAQVSIPSEMKGPAVGTNPDELLMGASAACFCITLAAMCEGNKIAGVKLACDSVATVDVNERGGLTFEAIHHKVVVSIPDRTPELEQRVTGLSHKADEGCMITKALKGNVAITYEISFE